MKKITVLFLMMVLLLTSCDKAKPVDNKNKVDISTMYYNSKDNLSCKAIEKIH